MSPLQQEDKTAGLLASGRGSRKCNQAATPLHARDPKEQPAGLNKPMADSLACEISLRSHMLFVYSRHSQMQKTVLHACWINAATYSISNPATSQQSSIISGRRHIHSKHHQPGHIANTRLTVIFTGVP